MLKEDCVIGNRVVATVNCDDGEYLTKDKIGTVKRMGEDDCIVCFDDNINGWNDKELGIKNYCGLFVSYENIELVEE
jgi:hypothetical protein